MNKTQQRAGISGKICIDKSEMTILLHCITDSLLGHLWLDCISDMMCKSGPYCLNESFVFTRNVAYSDLEASLRLSVAQGHDDRAQKNGRPKTSHGICFLRGKIKGLSYFCGNVLFVLIAC